ncbi:hypothetical protein DLJ49_18740 [Rhodovulum sp. 12E13]|uniref:hypothetical protein n=1 Tax=Rhodovulum sp. 12E13 TaxID=2203891 RepID=UPI000E193DD7|nr:hypothetical protein [Rhodovulum sp. 12E13]RDC69677.1 hypothetical protein DLJ49_18740 [Rhodovulum sp. 12E13]
MSLERKILADAPAPNTGHAADAPPEAEKPSGLEIRGGAAYATREPHVVEAGQVIRHQDEHTALLRTAIYRQDDGAIDPGRSSRWMIRATGDLTIALAKTPAVPASQIHPSGLVRRREADVEVVVYYAADVTVTWPVNIVWGGAGQPANPRPSGTSDRVTLRYNERTGEWWAFATHTEVVSADPLNPAPDPTEPAPEPDDPSDDGAPPGGDTDHDYTNPDNGDPMTPVQPPDEVPGAPGATGTLVALHDAAVSVSGNIGHTWRVYPGPASAAGMSALRGQGVVVRDSLGAAWETFDFATWEQLSFTEQIETELPLLNGGFELGNLAMWTVASENAPLPTDITVPQPREGRWMLGPDFNAATPDYEVRQDVELPNVAVGDVTVRGWAFVLSGGTAELEVRSDWDGQTWQPAPGQTLPPMREQSVFPYSVSDSLDSWSIEGPVQHLGALTYFEARVRWQDLIGTDLDKPVTESIEIRFSDSEGQGSWQGAVSGNYGNTSSASTARNRLVYIDFDARATAQQVDITLTNGARPGETVTVRIPAGWGLPYNREESTSSQILLTGREGSSQDDDPFYPYTLGTDPSGFSVTDTVTASNQWTPVSLTFPRTVGSPITVILRGSAEAVFWDEVSASIVETRTEEVTAVARDLVNRRHLLCTSESIHARADATTAYLAPSPFAATLAAAHGDTIVLADATQVAVSTDGGQAFATHALTGAAQVFAHPAPAVMLSNGQVGTVDPTAGFSATATLPAGTWLYWDARAQRWRATAPDGAGQVSTDLVTWTAIGAMPVSATAPDRRALATDSGRKIGWADESRDLFHAEAGNDWLVSIPLTEPILDIQEMK